MRGRRLLHAALIVPILLILTPPAHAGLAAVGVDDNVFDPKVVSGTFGGNVVWDWITPNRRHNVRQNKNLFYSGPATADDDAMFVRTVSAGTFPYYCEVHGSPSSGMRGTLKIRPGIDSEPDGLAFSVGWATDSTNTGAAFDVQYRVGTSGDWLPWLTDTTDGGAIFGDGDDPVTVTSGTTYQFRARSQKTVTAVKKVSKYSPKTTFVA